MQVQVSPTPIQVFASAQVKRSVRMTGGDTVYYGLTSTISSTSYTGTLTTGQALSIEVPYWFVTSRNIGAGTPGSANLAVEERDELEERLEALEDGGGGGDGIFILLEDESTGYPTRPGSTQPRIWIGWTDPTDLMDQYDIYIPVPAPA